MNLKLGVNFNCSFSVGFRIDVSGSYDWAGLTGTHKLKVLQRLPEKMHTIMRVLACGRIVHRNVSGFLETFFREDTGSS